jgi:hypothetical protein
VGEVVGDQPHGQAGSGGDGTVGDSLYTVGTDDGGGGGDQRRATRPTPRFTPAHSTI